MQTQLTLTVAGPGPKHYKKHVGWIQRITMKEIKISPYNRKWSMLINIAMLGSSGTPAELDIIFICSSTEEGEEKYINQIQR